MVKSSSIDEVIENRLLIIMRKVRGTFLEIKYRITLSGRGIDFDVFLSGCINNSMRRCNNFYALFPFLSR